MKVKRKMEILAKLESLTPKSPTVGRKKESLTIMEELLRLVPDRPKSVSSARELIEKLDIPSSPNLKQ